VWILINSSLSLIVINHQKGAEKPSRTHYEARPKCKRGRRYRNEKPARVSGEAERGKKSEKSTEYCSGCSISPRVTAERDIFCDDDHSRTVIKSNHVLISEIR